MPVAGENGRVGKKAGRAVQVVIIKGAGILKKSPVGPPVPDGTFGRAVYSLQ
jgi:hypothetical protein